MICSALAVTMQTPASYAEMHGSDLRTGIQNPAQSEDISATTDCLEALLNVKVSGEIGATDGADILVIQAAQDALGACGPVVLKCRESGSTLRFLIPLALLDGREYLFTGSARLMERPLDIYSDICKKQGLIFERGEDGLKVSGRLKAGEYELAGNVSSQFVSGLLFALPLLDGDSILRLIPPVESRPYIDMTLAALKNFGIEIVCRNEFEFAIPGGQRYKRAGVTVEGDFSNAAFLDAFNLLGGRVDVSGLNADSLQGDKVYKEHFRALLGGHPTIDISDCPDLGPVLMALAAMCEGAVFTGTDRLKIKESDRGTVMCEELGRIGITTLKDDNRIEVFEGKGNIAEIAEGRREKPEFYGHNDHRIVMALSLILSRTGGAIDGAEAVRKSFPDYFERISRLGIDVTLTE